MSDVLIRSIADTARWVAYHRATETESPNALFNDPFARRLAGERGALIASRLQGNAEFIALRTLLFDTLIRTRVEEQRIDTVVNLAAGLDTRPYRLPLPAGLRWVEIDLPEMIEMKQAAMAAEIPGCRVEAIAADLSSAAVRQRVFAEINAAAGRTLIVAEGLLTYLTEDDVAALAADLRRQSTFREWLVEVVSPETVRYVQEHWAEHLDAGGAGMHFAPADWRRFYRRLGWRPFGFRDIEREAVRLGRAAGAVGLRPRLGRLARTLARMVPPSARWAGQHESGVALLTRR